MTYLFHFDGFLIWFVWIFIFWILMDFFFAIEFWLISFLQFFSLIHFEMPSPQKCFPLEPAQLVCPPLVGPNPLKIEGVVAPNQTKSHHKRSYHPTKPLIWDPGWPFSFLSGGSSGWRRNRARTFFIPEEKSVPKIPPLSRHHLPPIVHHLAYLGQGGPSK